MKHKINVMHITSGNVPFPPFFGGGIEKYIHELSQSYLCQNFGVPSVITRFQTHVPNYPVISISKQSFSSVCMSQAFPIRLISKIDEVNFAGEALGIFSKAISQGEVDIAHVHNMFGASVFSFYGRMRNTLKHLYTDHAPQWTSMNLVKWYNKYVMRSLTKFIGESDKRIAVTNSGTRSSILKHVNLPPNSIINVGIGIDHTLFDSNSLSKENILEIAKKYNIDLDTFIILYVGAIIPIKGPQVLLHAISVLLSRIKRRISIIFIGSFSYYGKKGEEGSAWFYELLSKLGITENIHILTAIPTQDLLSIYKLSHVVVIPDLAQALPYSLLESMSMEKIVVASAIGGIPEVIRNETNGYLFPPGDIEALVNILSELLVDYPEKKIISRNARNTIISNYTWKKVAESNYNLYRQVLQE